MVDLQLRGIRDAVRSLEERAGLSPPPTWSRAVLLQARTASAVPMATTNTVSAPAPVVRMSTEDTPAADTTAAALAGAGYTAATVLVTACAGTAGLTTAATTEGPFEACAPTVDAAAKGTGAVGESQVSLSASTFNAEGVPGGANVPAMCTPTVNPTTEGSGAVAIRAKAYYGDGVPMGSRLRAWTGVPIPGGVCATDAVYASTALQIAARTKSSQDSRVVGDAPFVLQTFGCSGVAAALLHLTEPACYYYTEVEAMTHFVESLVWDPLGARLPRFWPPREIRWTEPSTGWSVAGKRMMTLCGDLRSFLGESQLPGFTARAAAAVLRAEAVLWRHLSGSTRAPDGELCSCLVDLEAVAGLVPPDSLEGSVDNVSGDSEDEEEEGSVDNISGDSEEEEEEEQHG